MDWLNTIAYEIQVVRYEDLVWFFDGSKQALSLSASLVKQIFDLVRSVRWTKGRLLAVLAAIVWLVLFYVLTVHYHVGNFYVMVSVFFGVFFGLGFSERREGEVSAYSIFNRGVRRLLGTFTATDIDHMMRHELNQVGRDDQILDEIQWEGKEEEEEEENRGRPRRRRRR